MKIKKAKIASAVDQVIAGVKQAVVAATNGARMEFAPNDGYGSFSKDEFYEDGGSNLGTSFNRMYELVSNAVSIAGQVQYFYGPLYLAGSMPNNQILDQEDYLKSVADRMDVSEMSNKKRAKLFDELFGAGLDFQVEQLPGHRARLSLRVDQRDTSTLRAYLSKIGVINSPDPAAVKRLNGVFGNMLSLGYDIKREVNVIRIPMEKACHKYLDRDSDGDLQHPIATMSNATMDLRLVNTRFGEPFRTMDYETYKTIEYPSIEGITDEKVQRQYMFEHVFANTDIHVMFSFELEADEAQYVTQTPAEQVELIDLGEWAGAAFKGALVDGDPVPFITPMPVVRSYVNAANKGIEPHPRTGVLGLMIRPSTLALWKMPTVDSMEAHRTDVQETHVRDNTFEFRPQVRIQKDGYSETQTVTTKDRAIAVDWTANILTTTSGGVIKYTDITDWGPATPWHLRRAVEDNSAGPDKGAFGITLGRVWTLAHKLGLLSVEGVLAAGIVNLSGLSTMTQRSYADTFATNKGSLLVNVRNILSQYISAEPAPQFVTDNFDENDSVDSILKGWYKFSEVNTASPVPLFAYMGSIMGAVYDRTKDMNLPEICGLSGLSVDTMMGWQAYMEIWNAYCRTPESYTALKVQDKAARAAYGKQPEDQDDVPADFKPASLPNIRDGADRSEQLYLMPHQAKAAYSLERLSRMPEGSLKFGVLDVDAGGGKTIEILNDIMRQVQAGVISRPAVYCPSNLLSNYVQDGNYASGGTLNIVPVNSNTVESFGKEYFEKVAKHGPPNTIFVINYDFLKWDPQWVSYGSHMVEWFGNAQWVRSLGIDGVWLDESHYLKNESGRTAAVRQGIVDTKYRVLATGTMLATKIEDVVEQMMLLDPGIFGTGERFANKYGGDGGVAATAYDFESGADMNMKVWMARQMQANACVVKGRRKEWAALLPPKQVQFYWVELTEAQRKVYEAVLTATIEDIKSDTKLMTLMEQGDEDFADVIDAAIQRYLQRIERVLTAPGADELSVALPKNETISPKGKMIGTIVKKHMAQKIPGKILVFTSYIESARAVFNSLPRDIQELFILFEGDATAKLRCREEFENNPKKIGMVGVENSMNTGINAQFASRLIRCESVYSPGTLEQGESRVNRPNVKKKEFRTGLYLDWVLVDKSIDVTKAGRLMWRAVDAAKFYNAESHAFQALPDLKPLRMTIDSIAANNSFIDVLPDYLDTYLKLENEVKAQEIADYKKRHPNLDFVHQPNAGLLKDSALLKQVPYVPGGELVNMDDLGLIPYPEFIRNHGEGKEMLGMSIHTDQGDGILQRILKNDIQINLNGVKSSFSKGSCFVITKTVTNAKEIRLALAKSVNLNAVDMDAIKLGQPVDIKSVTPVVKSKGIKVAPVNTSPVVPVTPVKDMTAPATPEDAETSEKAPTGKLMVQVRQTAAGGEWYDLTLVKDDKRGLMPDEQKEFYAEFLSTRLEKFAQQRGLSPDGCDMRLLDMHGHVLESTDGIDDWDEAMKMDYDNLDLPADAPAPTTRVIKRSDVTPVVDSDDDEGVKGASVKVTRNNSGNFVGYIGKEWFPLSDEDWKAKRWLADQIAKGGKLASSSVFNAKDIEEFLESLTQKPTSTPEKKMVSPVPEAVSDGGINVTPCFYNEFFALLVNADDQDLDALGVDLTEYGFKYAAPQGYLHLKRWQQARDLGIKLRDSGFEVSETFYKQLDFVQQAMKSNRTHFEQYKHLRTSMKDLQLFQLQRRKRVGPKELRPYFTICDGEVFVMIESKLTPAWSQLKSKVRVSGTAWTLDSESYIYLADTKSKIQSVVRALSKAHVLVEPDWVAESIQAMNTSARNVALK